MSSWQGANPYFECNSYSSTSSTSQNFYQNPSTIVQNQFNWDNNSASNGGNHAQPNYQFSDYSANHQQHSYQNYYNTNQIINHNSDFNGFSTMTGQNNEWNSFCSNEDG